MCSCDVCHLCTFSSSGCAERSLHALFSNSFFLKSFFFCIKKVLKLFLRMKFDFFFLLTLAFAFLFFFLKNTCNFTYLILLG